MRISISTPSGIQIPNNLPDAEKLKFVQEKLDAGDKGESKIWRSIGIYLGYALAHYADFYDMKHVLILGRCTSGLGGTLILDEARKVLEAQFPELPAAFSYRSRMIDAGGSASRLPLPVYQKLIKKRNTQRE